MELQFLNLARRGHIVHRVDGIPFRFVGAEGSIHSSFSFTIPFEQEDTDTKRSNVRDIRICKQIAEGIGAEGLEVGKVGAAKPRGAAVSVATGNLKVVVILSAKRLPRVVQCDVLTFTRNGRRAETQLIETEWATVLKTLEKVVRRDLKGSPLQWEEDDES